MKRWVEGNSNLPSLSLCPGPGSQQYSLFFPALLRHITLCKLKVCTCWLDVLIYCKMITIIALANTSLTSHNCHFFFVTETFKIYIHSNFQVYNTEPKGILKFPCFLHFKNGRVGARAYTTKITMANINWVLTVCQGTILSTLHILPHLLLSKSLKVHAVIASILQSKSERISRTCPRSCSC